MMIGEDDVFKYLNKLLSNIYVLIITLIVVLCFNIYSYFWNFIGW